MENAKDNIDGGFWKTRKKFSIYQLSVLAILPTPQIYLSKKINLSVKNTAESNREF